MNVRGWFGRALMVFLVFGSGCAAGPGGSVDAQADQLIKADRARAAAMVGVDRSELEARLHPALRYTHSTGSVDTRDTLIATLEEGRIDYREIESSAPTARVFGTTGVVTGPVAMQVVFEGKTIEVRSVYTAVYLRTANGLWHLLAYQSTNAPR